MKKIKEFDEIYIAKYHNILTTKEIALSYDIAVIEIEKIIDKLKQNGKYDKYKNIDESEWEKLENKNYGYTQKYYENKKRKDDDNGKFVPLG